MTLFIWDHFFSESKRMITQHRVLEAESTYGIFHFKADSIKVPVYISLKAGAASNNRPGELLKLYITEPGDSIDIRCYNKGQLVFSGKGSSKFEYQYRLDTLTENINSYFLSDHARYTDFQNKQYLNFEKTRFHQIDSLLSAQLSLLELYKPSLSEQAYQLFEAELIGKSVQNKYGCYASLLRSVQSNGIESRGQCDTTLLYQVFMQSVNEKKISVPDSILALSKEYSKSRIQLAMAAALKDSYRRADEYIRKNYEGILRDKLLTTYIIDNFDFIPSADSALAITLQNIQTPYCKEPLLSIQNRLSKGSLVYNFILEDSNGKYQKLSDFLGKTVFLDFWYTGCTGCVQLYKNALAEIEHEYKNDSSVVFISISIDTNKDTWLKSIKTENYTSEQAVNLTTGKIGADHPVINRYGVSFFPKTFLIDKTGRIVCNTTSIRSKAAFLEILKEATK